VLALNPKLKRLTGRGAASVLLVAPPVVKDELVVVLAEVRLRDERTVTVPGRAGVEMLPRGEAFGGVEVGAGSLERAVCTRSSSFCIFPIRPLI
jgi:hypothetical protein